MIRHLHILAGLALCVFAHAKDSDLPLSDLPEGVKPIVGSISLYADYNADSSDGTIPVYLINDTTEILKLGAQDGDIYLKLEAQDKDGKWVRAQPHVFSWCGNSYFYSPTIRPQHFIKVSGYQPKEGKKQKIRFSLYRQQIDLSSNVGTGLASVKDIELAANDEMTKRMAQREMEKKQNKSALDNP